MPSTQEELSAVRVGDAVIRWLSGAIPQRLVVTAVDEETITCGAWGFDRATGAEIDDTLGWGPSYGITGSFLGPDDPRVP